MTETSTETKQNRRQTVIATALLLTSVLLVGTVVVFLQPVGTSAAANNTTNISDQAPYYDNESNISNPDPGWFNGGNVTLDGVVDMVTRIPGYIIGTGQQDQSGTGFIGVLLTGLLMAGGALGMIMGAGVGAIGGTIVALAVGFGLTTVGLAPAFIRPILLFAIGILAATAFRRATQ